LYFTELFFDNKLFDCENAVLKFCIAGTCFKSDEAINNKSLSPDVLAGL